MLSQNIKCVHYLLLVLAICLPCQLAFAQVTDDLDDITIRVIGLDEIPGTTMQVIDFPEPDLGEMNNIQEGASRQNNDFIQDADDLAGADGVESGASTDATTGGTAGAGAGTPPDPQE